jgi:hypothetical protein
MIIFSALPYRSSPVWAYSGTGSSGAPVPYSSLITSAIVAPRARATAASTAWLTP